MSRPIYREEALRRYSVREQQADKPLVIRKAWFVLFWGLVALLGAAGAGLAVVQVPNLVTVQVMVTGYQAEPASHFDVTAQVPQDRDLPRAGDEATVRLAGRARPLSCHVTDPGGPVVTVERLKKRFATATGPARLAVLSCQITGEQPDGLLRRSGEAVIPSGTVAAGTLLLGGGS
ncbi:hypothetical protein [Sphaerisporangium perillae]|uniref:hypothetical protein n=1 Tax=Sphaerisporangium perillae TaxID=2935860 RepID=UPI00200D4CB8|nr:hypothetical protein [Sphaerisporangium perillae]